MGGLTEFLFPHGRTARLEEVIDEHDSMPNKAMVADVRQFTDEGMGLHRHTMTPNP